MLRRLCLFGSSGDVGSLPPATKSKKPEQVFNCRSGSRLRLSARLLAWYDIHRRVLPWRAPKGKRADPYKIWLSEIMLQQTTVQAVGAYYRKFLARGPDVTALANARQDGGVAAR